MAVFKGGKNREDMFVGGTRADRFEFDPADLTASDVIVGGPGRAIDTLLFTRVGTIGADALAGVSGIERIVLASGTNSLTVSDTLVATVESRVVEIVGGAGNDTVDASSLSADNAVSVSSGAGRDHLTGGAGSDRFTFATADLNGLDVVVGGAGTDTLSVTGAGRITAAALAGVSGIEAIVTDDQSQEIIVPHEMLLSADARTLSIITGSGNDIIDARNVRREWTIGNGVLNISAGAGNDNIFGPTNGELSDFGIIGVFIDGGKGADLIDSSIVPGARVVYDNLDYRVSALQGRLIVSSGASLDLTQSDDQSRNDGTVLRGFISVDASTSNRSVRVVGVNEGFLIGGSGADTLSGSRSITGGGGADLLIGTQDSNGTTFLIGDGDFVAGEAILGQTGNDSLYVSGDADMTTGTVTGIRDIALTLGANGATGHLILAADQVSDLSYISGGGKITIRLGEQHELALRSLSGGNSAIILEVEGTRTADTIATGYSGQRATVFGGGGNDILSGGGDLFGGGGSDRIFYNRQSGGSQTIDGGGGSDTIVSEGYGDTVIRLAAVDDQTLNDSATVRGMENLDYSANFAGAVDAIGSDAANIMIGGSGSDRLDGGAGDDVLEGGLGTGDVLIGGAGADQFRFGEYAGSDAILDYTVGEDRLVFVRTQNDPAAYDFVGNRFDMRVVAGDTSANLAKADLIIYTASASATVDDLSAFLREDGTGVRDEGVFIVAVNEEGHTVLYHTSDASGQNSSFNVVADLGTVPVTVLTLSDFAFI